MHFIELLTSRLYWFPVLFWVFLFLPKAPHQPIHNCVSDCNELYDKWLSGCKNWDLKKTMYIYTTMAMISRIMSKLKLWPINCVSIGFDVKTCKMGGNKMFDIYFNCWSEYVSLCMCMSLDGLALEIFLGGKCGTEVRGWRSLVALPDRRSKITNTDYSHLTVQQQKNGTFRK